MKVDAGQVLKELPLVLAKAPPVVLATQDDGDGAIPAELRQWLVRLRLLDGVPFAYLLPDTALLPEESIRWFYVDRRWTDALVQGALAVGTVNSDDRTQLTARYPGVRDELDRGERIRRRAAVAVVAGGAGGAAEVALLPVQLVPHAGVAGGELSAVVAVHGADRERALHQRVGPAAVHVKPADRLLRQQRGVRQQVGERHPVQQPQPHQPLPQLSRDLAVAVVLRGQHHRRRLGQDQRQLREHLPRVDLHGCSAFIAAPPSWPPRLHRGPAFIAARLHGRPAFIAAPPSWLPAFMAVPPPLRACRRSAGPARPARRPVSGRSTVLSRSRPSTVTASPLNTSGARPNPSASSVSGVPSTVRARPAVTSGSGSPTRSAGRATVASTSPRPSSTPSRRSMARSTLWPTTASTTGAMSLQTASRRAVWYPVCRQRMSAATIDGRASASSRPISNAAASEMSSRPSGTMIRSWSAACANGSRPPGGSVVGCGTNGPRYQERTASPRRVRCASPVWPVSTTSSGNRPWVSCGSPPTVPSSPESRPSTSERNVVLP